MRNETNRQTDIDKKIVCQIDEESTGRRRERREVMHTQRKRSITIDSNHVTTGRQRDEEGDE